MPAVSDLEGEAIGRLTDLIVDAFDRDELKLLLKVKLNLDLARQVNIDDDDEKIVFELILRMSRLGITTDFLRVIQEARPDRRDLRNFIGEVAPQALQPATDPKVSAAVAAKGLSIVKERLTDPAVRRLVAPHRDELERLMEDIEILANYKRLHDFLQTIQFTHHLQMTHDMQRLRTDEIAGITLEAHIFQIDELYRNAHAAAQALPDIAAVRAAELRWMGKLRSALDRIRKAVETLDDQEGLQGLRALRSFSRSEPYRINSLLSTTAERMPLERLVSVVAAVAEATASDEASSEELREGLGSLQSLLPQLKGRVAEHSQWQDIEREFMETDDFIEQGTQYSVEAFRDMWAETKKCVAALAGTEPDSLWAQKSQKQADIIDATLSGEIEKARKAFGLYRHTVLFHFFQVDRALRYQCEAILAIKRPLSSLLSEV